MNMLRTNKNSRIWVIFLLASFWAQGVLAGVHMYSKTDMTISDPALQSNAVMTSHCQGGTKHDQEPASMSVKVTKTGLSTDCCEDGCQMSACHSVSMILTSVRFPTLGFHNASNFFLKQAAASEPVSSLYRPPILG